MNTTLRKKRLVKAARLAGVDGLVITALPDIRYLCGFTGSSGALAFAGGRAVLFTDGRYTEQATKEARGTRLVIAKGSPAVAACGWMDGAGVKRCGYDPGLTTVSALAAMRKAVRPERRRGMFVPVAGLVSGLRETKDAEEVAAMRAAAQTGCELLAAMLLVLRPGMTEVEAAVELERRARMAGAERMSFETIMASGPRSALPHARASQAKLPRRGFLTLDFGVVLEGYCSDMTRTVHFGRATAEERAVYDAVLEAQMCAVARVAAGVCAGDVDEAARGVLRRAKLDDFFAHSTGHGVGLEIHEGPRVGAKQKEVLRPGMIITIEPGAYLPGRFGVRIEDTVLVTATGCEVLTPSPKAWMEL